MFLKLLVAQDQIRMKERKKKTKQKKDEGWGVTGN